MVLQITLADCVWITAYFSVIGPWKSCRLIGGYPVSSTESVSTGFFTRIAVITTTPIRTSRVPRIVRRLSVSPPRKYPTSTATTGFTDA
jgi:hypothetical protein